MAETRETAPAMWGLGPEQQGAQLVEGWEQPRSLTRFGVDAPPRQKREFSVLRVPREGNRPRLHRGKSLSVRMKTMAPTAISSSGKS